jgi:uncharacterized protein YkwD
MTIECKVCAFLALLAVVLFATFFPDFVEKSLASYEPDSAPVVWQPEHSPEQIAARILGRVNMERRKAGLKALAVQPVLAQIAQQRSQDMAKRNYFDHYDPKTGKLAFVRLFAKRGLGGGGENLFLIQGQVDQIPESAVAWWMSSSSHRKNILDPSFGKTGVGVVVQTPRVYITQVFLYK